MSRVENKIPNPVNPYPSLIEMIELYCLMVLYFHTTWCNHSALLIQLDGDNECLRTSTTVEFSRIYFQLDSTVVLLFTRRGTGRDPQKKITTPKSIKGEILFQRCWGSSAKYMPNSINFTVQLRGVSLSSWLLFKWNKEFIVWQRIWINLVNFSQTNFRS